MYTGMGPKQPVDKSRLQEGIKFLHAYQLCRKPGEAGPDASADLRMSNLYGIQISSQLPNKDGTGMKESGQRDPEGSRSTGRAEWAERSRARSSQAVGLEGIASDPLPPGMRPLSSVASGDDSDISTRIKEERLDYEEQEQEREEGDKASLPPPAPRSLHSPGQENPCQPGLALLCPHCGERCLSPEGLQEHLISHAACSLEPLMEGAPSEDADLGGPGGAEDHRTTAERLDAGCLEEALRQSQALADEIAAELRRGGGAGGVGIGGFTGSSPMVGLFTRKRKIACAVCNQRFVHKSQLQEHMFTHVGKAARIHQHQRYSRFCNQLLQVTCDGTGDGTQGTGAGPGEGSTEDRGARDAQDNGSSCYSLDSEVSRESVDAIPVE